MVDLVHRIAIAASPAKVYAAAATQEGLRSWWTADAVSEEKVGGACTFGFNRRATVFRMTIAALEPGRSVALHCLGEPAEWNGTTQTWTIAPDGAGSVLHFVHGNWRAMTDMCAICNTTWGELMHRLKAHAETGRPQPHWTE